MDDDQARWYDQTSQNGKLSSQVYLLGAWNYDISSILNLEASTFLKSASGAKTQTDLGLKIKYKELCWLGLNSQLNNNMSLLLPYSGLTLMKNILSDTHTECLVLMLVLTTQAHTNLC